MQPEPWKDARPEDPVCVWGYFLIGPILQDKPPHDLLAQDHYNVFQYTGVIALFPTIGYGGEDL